MFTSLEGEWTKRTKKGSRTSDEAEITTKWVYCLSNSSVGKSQQRKVEEEPTLAISQVTCLAMSWYWDLQHYRKMLKRTVLMLKS